MHKWGLQAVLATARPLLGKMVVVAGYYSSYLEAPARRVAALCEHGMEPKHQVVSAQHVHSNTDNNTIMVNSL
jgi:hypothetical protein